MTSMTMTTDPDPLLLSCIAVRNCEKHLKENFADEYALTKKAPNPFPLGYEAETDISPLCPDAEASYFQTIIGVMRWLVELGRIDIAV